MRGVTIWRMKAAFVPLACLPFAACTTVASGPGPAPYVPIPIVAVAADDIGVVASATPQSNGASLTVGYKGAKFAIMPVESQKGSLLALKKGPKETQTYSIFTQLGLDAKAGASSGVAVEQVLAVGPAADAWVANARPFPATPAAPPPKP